MIESTDQLENWESKQIIAMLNMLKKFYFRKWLKISSRMENCNKTKTSTTCEESRR